MKGHGVGIRFAFGGIFWSSASCISYTKSFKKRLEGWRVYKGGKSGPRCKQNLLI
jgi:hypothetical protein